MCRVAILLTITAVVPSSIILASVGAQGDPPGSCETFVWYQTVVARTLITAHGHEASVALDLYKDFQRNANGICVDYEHYLIARTYVPSDPALKPHWYLVGCYPTSLEILLPGYPVSVTIALAGNWALYVGQVYPLPPTVTDGGVGAGYIQWKTHAPGPDNVPPGFYEGAISLSWLWSSSWSSHFGEQWPVGIRLSDWNEPVNCGWDTGTYDQTTVYFTA